MGLIQIPHIPTQKATVCAIGAGHDNLQQALEQRGIQTIILSGGDHLLQPVQNHADLLLHHAGGEMLWIDSEQPEGVIQQLQAYGFITNLLHKPLEPAYPKDAVLCCFALGEQLICFPKGIDRELLNYYQSKEKNIVSVKQGYTKCSCCIVNERSVITADIGIGTALSAIGMDVLQIPPGYIKLLGYNYGFIGGCSGLLSVHELAFYGNLTTHPAYRDIVEFCEERNASVVSLCSQQPLTDIGGILPLVE